jgi:hypothetical protein
VSAELANTGLGERYRAALRIARDLDADERYDLLALVLWGAQDANGAEHVPGRAERRAERDANGQQSRGGPLTFETRQMLRQLVDRRARERLDVVPDRRHCRECRIWHQRGFTPGCEECARRAEARLRRERYTRRRA